MATKKTQSTRQTQSTRSKTTRGARNTVASTKGNKYLSGYDWGRIFAKAWSDPKFKRQVEMDPTTAIREFLGKDYDGVNIFNIPPKPKDVDKRQLNNIVAGEEPMYHCSHLC